MPTRQLAEERSLLISTILQSTRGRCHRGRRPRVRSSALATAPRRKHAAATGSSTSWVEPPDLRDLEGHRNARRLASLFTEAAAPRGTAPCDNAPADAGWTTGRRFEAQGRGPAPPRGPACAGHVMVLEDLTELDRTPSRRAAWNDAARRDRARDQEPSDTDQAGGGATRLQTPSPGTIRTSPRSIEDAVRRSSVREVG